MVVGNIIMKNIAVTCMGGAGMLHAQKYTIDKATLQQSTQVKIKIKTKRDIQIKANVKVQQFRVRFSIADIISAIDLLVVSSCVSDFDLAQVLSASLSHYQVGSFGLIIWLHVVFAPWYQFLL